MVVGLGRQELGKQPEVVLERWHVVAVRAGVPQVYALAELRAPVSGLSEDLVSHGAERVQHRDARVPSAPLALATPAML
eukprot:617583-Lingulodinium_polyedra.AAC.1